MEKSLNKNDLKRFLAIFLVLAMILVTPILVNSLTFDNIKGDLIIDETTSIYGKVEIKDWFGLLDLATIELKRNTDTCGYDCSMETKIIMYQKGALIDDVRFKQKDWDNTWNDLDLQDYQFYIATSGTEWEVEDYKEECNDKLTWVNGSKKITCKEVLAGTYHVEDNYVWEEYILGTEVEEGEYMIKLEATRPSAKWVDWIIKTQGKELDFWYVWGELIAGPVMSDTGGSYEQAVATNGSIFLVGAVGTNKFYKYYMNYTKYTGSPYYEFTDNIVAEIWGITWNGSHWMGMDTCTNAQCPNVPIHVYNTNWVYWGDIEFTDGGTFRGICANSSRIWVADSLGDDYLEIDYSGNVIQELTGLGAADGNGIAMNDSTLFISGDYSDPSLILAYDFDGTARGSFATQDKPMGMSLWNESIYVAEYDSGIWRYFNAPYTPPSSTVTTTLNEPEDYYNTTSNSITFNCSTNTSIGYVANITLWLNITGTWIANETVNFGSGSENSIQLTKSIPDGINYQWTCRGYNNSTTSDWGTNRTFSIDTILPTITINSPTGTEDYGYEGLEETLNWTIVDTNFDSVWYNYNGTNFTLNGAINTSTFTLETSPFNITIWANDTLGNTNSETITWSYRVFENEQAYVSSTYEGKTNPFTYNLTYISTDWDVIIGTLVYNNTNYSSSKIGTGNNLLFTSNVYAPNINSQQNISFYWRIGLTNVSGTTNIEAATYNQTVKIINMSLCGHPYIVPFLNFTCYDESTYTIINCTTSLTFEYQIEGANFFQSFSYENDSSVDGTFDFCFDPSGETFTINAVMEYSATGYAQRYYNFEGISFTNTTTEIGLYLLNTSSSTSFMVVVQNENYQPLASVEVYMQKYNPGTGTWNTVEIATTNDDGETVAHIYDEDSIYRFKIYEDGTLIHTSSGSVIACPSTPCTVTITISEGIPTVIPTFEDLDDLTSSLTYSKTTEVITYTYSDTSGNFSIARLYVIRSNPGTPDILFICNDTSLSSTAVLTCDLTGENNGTYIATGFITRVGEIERIVQRKAILKIRDIVGVIGLDGVLWSMFLFIGILMLGIYRPSLGIFFGIAGVILISFLELMEISITAIVAVVGIGAILLLEARKQ